MKSKTDDHVKQNIILDFLKTAGLVIDNSLNTLEGQVIPRDLLLLTEKYEECKTKIDAMRDCMSSSRLTCLQSTAETNQKWPLLNAVRQMLKTCNFKMTPLRISDGYTKDGKKILRRYFRIDKIRTLKIANPIINNDDDETNNDEE
jgi:hypothetical protein